MMGRCQTEEERERDIRARRRSKREERDENRARRGENRQAQLRKLHDVADGCEPSGSRMCFLPRFQGPSPPGKAGLKCRVLIPASQPVHEP